MPRLLVVFSMYIDPQMWTANTMKMKNCMKKKTHNMEIQGTIKNIKKSVSKNTNQQQGEGRYKEEDKY